MYTRLRRARRGDDDGFSMVELFVITAIIGVLALIAIATYLTQRDKAQRSSAIASLRNTETLVESIREDTDELATTAAEYAAESSAFSFVDAPDRSDDQRLISVWGDDTVPVVAFAVQGGNYCYYMRVDDTIRTFHHRQPIGDVDCEGSEFQAGPGDGWG